MVCSERPSEEDTISCTSCATPWHIPCLPPSRRPQTLAEAPAWECPDCDSSSLPADGSGGGSESPVAAADAAAGGGGDSLVAAIRAIEADPSLTDQEKAARRQRLMSGGGDGSNSEKGKGKEGGDAIGILDDSFNCSICMQLPERPVTTPCGHNFCLKCFERWISLGKGKFTCANCRNAIPAKMAHQPRINSSLVMAIRMAKTKKASLADAPLKNHHYIQNQDRPDKAYTTDRAKKTGKANACSGKIFVTVPPDHFGPILAENDPDRGQGLMVGESWEDRLECRQWGAHRPMVGGIAGQAKHGAQSVALSGGYQDDEDHGEWFLYTGSGGRDLSGNKRTNKDQSSDQKFTLYNESLRVSCRHGYPVRVVRSHKEKRSSYAPEKGVRYDGIYRIEKCWRKEGSQGFKVCRYLFVRCDNDPAPWTSDDHGDRPRPLPVINELGEKAIDITERKANPSWDFDEEKGCWMWKKTPPRSQKMAGSVGPERKKRSKIKSLRKELVEGFSCLICRNVMTDPLTTPCGHNFCKGCLEGAFAGQSFINQRDCGGRRTLRAKKNVMKCPSCSTDVSDFLQNPQVNRQLKDLMESLQRRAEAEEAEEKLEEEELEEDEADEEELEEEEKDTCSVSGEESVNEASRPSAVKSSEPVAGESPLSSSMDREADVVITGATAQTTNKRKIARDETPEPEIESQPKKVKALSR